MTIMITTITYNIPTTEGEGGVSEDSGLLK